MNGQSETVEAGTAAAHAQLRVVGRGSFRSAPALRQFSLCAIEHGCREVLCDLSGCPGMDSTFSGVLAQIGLDLKRHEGGRLTLRGMSPKVENGLRTLGLDRIAVFAAAGTPPAECGTIPMQPLQLAAAADRTVLSAHEALADLSDENRLKFRGVIECLKAET
jgi:anti-sigma B factor antagonist